MQNWLGFCLDVNKYNNIAIVDTSQGYFEIILNRATTIENLFMTASKGAIVYKDPHTPKKGSNRTSVPIGIFTTAWARLKLLELCMTIPEHSSNVHYLDTDAVIYKYCQHNDPIPTSPLVGHLTSEIQSKFSDSAFGKEFVSLGAKTYSLVCQTPEGVRYITRCKGLTLDRSTQDIVNF